MNRHISVVLLLAALAISATACHKKAPSPAAQPDQAAAPATDQPLVGEVDPVMTGQLQLFIQQAGRLPTNFNELARTRLDRVPRTPPGMKWAIDPVTHEVKLVKQ